MWHLTIIFVCAHLPRSFLAKHFSAVNTTVPKFLNLVNAFHSVLGPKPLAFISSWLNSATNHFVPVWNPYMPKGAAPLKGGC